MITEKDLNEAIVECMGQRNPSSSTCLKLAAFLIIKKELFGDDVDKEAAGLSAMSPYTYATPQNQTIDYYGDSEFAKAIHGHTSSEIIPVMDELMEALKVINPRLYDGTMRRLR